MKKIFSMNRFEGWNLSLPLIQGGMGVGVSLSGLAGAVASEGGMGVISTAQIGFEEPDFVGNEEACNLRSIRKHIVRAKELASGKGMIAVNVMVALQQYREHVKEAVRAGADAVICGAGLPVDLPELVEAGKAKIAPIVSSRRAAALLLKTWDKKYGRTADFIVTEGPEAGGTRCVLSGGVGFCRLHYFNLSLNASAIVSLKFCDGTFTKSEASSYFG